MGFNRDWLLRIALASVFLFHGIGKFTGEGAWAALHK